MGRTCPGDVRLIRVHVYQISRPLSMDQPQFVYLTGLFS